MARGSALFGPVAICLLSVVSGQQNPPSVPQFRTRVDLVVLDVSVLDRDRRPVKGLAAADFVITEDGRPQSIQMFNAVDVPEPEAAPAASWTREVAPDVRDNAWDARGQIVVLVLDDASPMSAGDLMRARDCARSVIARLGPRDLAAVAFVADARSGQEFTHDKTRLLAALDRFGGPAPGTGVPRTRNGLDPGWDVGALEMMGGTMALRALKGQAEALADLPAARKAIIYISTRGAALPDVVTGLGSAGGEASGGQNAGGVQSDVRSDPRTGLDATGMQVDNLGEFGEMVRAAQRANLNIYCVDPGGLRAPATRPTPFDPHSTTASIHNPNVTGIASLLALSHNTGGFAIVETNDPQPGLTQIFRENRSYYLLAYASSNSRVEGRYRRLDVRVNRPGVTVRARNGYFEPDRKEMKKAAAASSSPDAALAAPVARSDIPMQVTAAPFAIAGKRQAAVAVALAIRQAGTESVSNLTVTVSAYDYLARRRASNQFRTRAVLKPARGGDAIFEVLTRLDLAPGRYHLRTAVAQAHEANTGSRPATGGAVRSGSVFCDLDVPDFAREPLSLSGVTLTPPAGLRAAGGERLKSVIPVTPSTRRQFISNDNVRAFVRVYQGGRQAVADVTITARIFDERNAAVFETTESLAADRFSPARSADYSLALPLARLTPAQHLLTIEAKLGVRTARRDVRFTLR